jgi:cytochrome c556
VFARLSETSEGKAMMMIRAMLAIAALAIGVGALGADESPIKARQALMKKNGDHAKVVAAMAKGEAPFDLAKAKAAFAAFHDSAVKAPDLFPENSKTGEDTAALPKIWEDTADFKARFAKLAQDTKEAQDTVTDFATFKTAIGVVGKDCGGCHELYRKKKT